MSPVEDASAPSAADAVSNARPWGSEEVLYEEMTQLSLSADSDVIIIDVREDFDFAAGHIPTSLNLPISVFEGALSLDQDVFVRRYLFPKPSPSQKIVLYCRSGRRSKIALEICKGAGFTAVREYSGSWLDWTARQEKEKEQAVPKAEA